MSRSGLITFAFCLRIFQLSNGNVLKLQSRNGNKNINKIKVCIFYEQFFTPFTSTCFIFILFFFWKIPVVVGKMNRTVQSTQPPTTTTQAPLTTPGLSTAFECYLDSVSWFWIHVWFSMIEQLIHQKGELWQVADCDPPGSDCVSLTLPGEARSSGVDERICCSSPETGITYVTSPFINSLINYLF